MNLDQFLLNLEVFLKDKQDMTAVNNDFLEHAIVSEYDTQGHDIYDCKHDWTTKYYYNSKQMGKEYIDIDEEIYEEDIPNFCLDLNHAGITKFTFSYEFSANQSIAKIFEDNGFKLKKLHYYRVHELSWNKLDDSGKPTEDTTQVPIDHEVIIPAYLFEKTS